VLSPFIPDGSRFLLRFTRQDIAKDGTISPTGSVYSQATTRAPESPSAAPSPHQSNPGLSVQQVALLQKQLHDLATASQRRYRRQSIAEIPMSGTAPVLASRKNKESLDQESTNPLLLTDKEGPPTKEAKDDQDCDGDDFDGDQDDMMLHSEDPVESKLRQILFLLTAEKSKKKHGSHRRYEKRQVVFLVANYFVLFLSLVAASAEIQARLPEWMRWMEAQLKNVQDCAKDQEALFQCISNGDYAGLVASVLLWLSRSFATKKVFLFGFESTKHVWNVVYESFITSICWGISYLFIRRGLNPDTRHRFLQKYWKDAVYGSLAGFNAAFLKQILKNLIPKEAVEDAFRERQFRFLKWFPNFE
jgi:stalled ribosome alternative rescue factor ArfA